MLIDCPTRWNSAHSMLTRAVYLRPAIERFIHEHADIHEKWVGYTLTESEWKAVESLITILEPFKIASHKHQTTSRPLIDQVLWTYDDLFNQLDKLDEFVDDERDDPLNSAWAILLSDALKSTRTKLSKYYEKTGIPYVYADSVILNPWTKLDIFEGDSYVDDDMDWKMEYENRFRLRFDKDYQGNESTSSVDPARGHKRKRASSDDTYEDSYRLALKRSKRDKVCGNEFDSYLKNQPIQDHDDDSLPDLLAWWKINGANYPKLSRMFRDTFSAVSNGSGVEREFSKSGRVVRHDRGRLNHGTITDLMMYKNRTWRENEYGHFGDCLEDIVNSDNLISAEMDEGPCEGEQRLSSELWARHFGAMDKGKGRAV